MSSLPTVAISDIAEVNPPTSIAYRGTASFIGMEDVSGNFALTRTSDRHVSQSHGYLRFQDNDLLFAKITPCMENGKGAHVSGLTNGIGFGSTEFHVLRAGQNGDSRFLAHWLQNIGLRLAAEAQMTGSAGQRRVPKNFFSRYRIPFFSLPEQRRIAEILDTLDDQIRATERIIAKLGIAADGLIDNLLTCGIDKSGQLRDPIRKPDEFTDTPLGRLPRSWKVNSLGAVVREDGGLIQTGPFGSQLHAYDYVTSGVPVVMPQDINHGRISVAAIARISEMTAAGLSRHRVRPGDVLFARRGDLTRCAEITERESSWLCGTGCLLVRLPHATVRAGWLSAIYRHEIGQQHIRATAVGSTMPNLSGSILSRLLMPVPEVDEQVAIIRIIEAHRTRLNSETLRREKLRTTKAGLMSDLLTGRVRVPLDTAS